MQNRHLPLIALAVALLMSAGDALACSCVEPAAFDPKAAVEAADAVFVGRVTNVDEWREGDFVRGYRLTLQVSEAWKGVESERVTLTTGAGGGDCGFPFEADREYLVQAWRSGEQRRGDLNAGICSYTARAEDAEPHLRELREWRAPKTFRERNAKN